MEGLTAVLSAFAVIVPVELPDKTFVATLVLSTRYRPLAVWAGAVAAFAIQCAVAVAAGRMIALLPATPVRVVAAALFATGAFLLVSGGAHASEREERAPASTAVASDSVSADREEAEHEREFAEKAAPGRTGWRAFGASFAVLFLAEWGDLSQLLTAGLVASGRPAVPVFIGSWLGLAFLAGMGVLLGRVILRYVRLQIIRYVGAAVCITLAGIIIFELTAG